MYRFNPLSLKNVYCGICITKLKIGESMRDRVLNLLDKIVGSKI